MQDLRAVTSPTTLSLSLAGGCWAGPKVEATDEIVEFIVDFYTTSNTVRENKYGRKLLKEF